MPLTGGLTCAFPRNASANGVARPQFQRLLAVGCRASIDLPSWNARKTWREARMSHVALSVRDRYLHVAEQDGHVVVRVDAPDLDAATVLVRVALGHDRIALRTADGDYLAVRPE